MILAGDIGGTKTVLALFEPRAGALVATAEATFKSADFATLKDVVVAFRATHPFERLDGACFGVAGPVHDGKAKLTNLPWVLDEAQLARDLGTPKVALLNDLTAAAYGMLFLAPEEFHALQGERGLPKQGTIAVVAPGTGLGEAILYFDGQRYHALPSEGGHTDFAPIDDTQIDLLRHLRKAVDGHVSYERILSGAGIGAVYDFCRLESKTPEPAWLTTERTAGDPNAAITQAALAHKDPVCEKALDIFATVLGAEAGNLALKCLASTVILGGGIPPKILPALQAGAFSLGLGDKGRFTGWTESLSVQVALNPRAPLLGAANYLSSDRIHR